MPQPTLLNNEIRDMLMDCGLFDPLLPEDFHVAAGYFNISSIAQGEVIFLEGDAGTFMCILHSGQVAVQKTNHEGQRLTIATLRQWPGVWRDGGAGWRTAFCQLHRGKLTACC